MSDHRRPIIACFVLPGRRTAALFTLAAVLLVAAALSGCTTTASRLVVLVRHAEKGILPPTDPNLTEEGMRRARALARRLSNADIRHVIATPYARTIETAQPLADSLGIELEIIPVSADISAHIRAVADAVRREPAGEAVLVVGHSNTIPAIVGLLGGPRLETIKDEDYDNLYVLVLDPDGRVRTVRASFY